MTKWFDPLPINDKDVEIQSLKEALEKKNSELEKLEEALTEAKEKLEEYKKEIISLTKLKHKQNLGTVPKKLFGLF